MSEDVAVDLTPNGKVIIILGDREVVLRIPTVREQAEFTDAYLTIVEAQTVAAQEASTELNAVKDDESLTVEEKNRLVMAATRKIAAARTSLGEGAPMLWARILEVLAGEKVDPDGLPVWSIDIDLLGTVMGHWRTAPLDFLQRRKKLTP